MQVSDVTETSVPDTELPAIEETPTIEASMNEDPEYRIITLLPKDAIRSIDDPEFYSVPEADEESGVEAGVTILRGSFRFREVGTTRLRDRSIRSF